MLVSAACGSSPAAPDVSPTPGPASATSDLVPAPPGSGGAGRSPLHGLPGTSSADSGPVRSEALLGGQCRRMQAQAAAMAARAAEIPPDQQATVSRAVALYGRGADDCLTAVNSGNDALLDQAGREIAAAERVLAQISGRDGAAGGSG